MRLSVPPFSSAPLRPPATVQYMFNGRRFFFQPSGLRERHGAVDAVFTMHRTLLAAWTSVLTLLPLDVTAHPASLSTCTAPVTPLVYLYHYRSLARVNMTAFFPRPVPTTVAGVGRQMRRGRRVRDGSVRRRGQCILCVVRQRCARDRSVRRCGQYILRVLGNDSSAVSAVLQSSFYIAN